MSNPERTLVILTPGFARNEADTTCLPMQQSLVKAIKRNYPHINIIILAFQYPYFKKEYKWFDTTVISFNGQNKGGIQRLLLRQPLYKTLKRINESENILGLLSFWYGECAAIGNHFANKYGLNHFCWILGQDAKKENKYPGRTRLKADNLIALSDFLQNEFEKNHGIKPAHLVTAGIDTTEFGISNNSKDIDILGAGSLIQLKQYPIFIEAVAEIKKQIPDIKAMLIGDGHEKENLQSLISKYSLKTNITLTGELPHQEVLRLMQRSKIFLHPSSYEGFSGVCLEALYAGCHIISFRKAMNDEIDQWHIVSSKEEMIQKTLTILQNPSTAYNQILFSSMGEVAKKMITLFFENR